MRLKASVIYGLLLCVTILVVILKHGEAHRFVALLRHLNPVWLLMATVYQGGTYVCAAAVWWRVLAYVGVRLPLHHLVPLGLAKLFVDQVVPTAGVGGTLLVVRGLGRRGVAPPLATAALLLDLLSYYAAHALTVVLTLGIVWLNHDMHPVVLVLTALFAVIAVTIPLGILWLNRRGRPGVPRWLRRLPGLLPLVQAMAEAPTEVLRDLRLLGQASVLQLAIVLLDAATLDAMLRAVGSTLAPAAVLACFTIGAVAAIVGILPGGLGLVEGSTTVMLHWFDVPIEAALAATLLLRVWSFWLPMAPGLWLARHETC